MQRVVSVSRKEKYGWRHSIFLKVCKHFTLEGYCTGIWSVPIYSDIITFTSWVILMYLKSMLGKITFATHKQEPHIMRVLRYGGISLMTVRVTYGLSDAYCTRWESWDHLSTVKTWSSYFVTYRKVKYLDWVMNTRVS